MESMYQLKLTLYTSQDESLYGIFKLGDQLKFSQNLMKQLKLQTEKPASCFVKAELLKMQGEGTVTLQTGFSHLSDLRHNENLINRQVIRLFKTEQGQLS